MPTVLIRADASPQLGGGHVMRCLTLARDLQQRGWDVTFAMNTGATACVPGLAQAGMRLCEGFDDLSHENAALQAQFSPPDLLIIDHYRYTHAMEHALKAWAPLRLAVDDFAVPNAEGSVKRDCEMLLNPNIGAHAAAYAGRVPEGALVLAGPHYALLRAEFVAAADARLAIRNEEPAHLQRIVLAFGLTDLGGITAQIAAILRGIDANLDLDAIIGPQAEGRAALEARLPRHPQLNIHIAPPDIAQIMAKADFAIGAAGQSSYERCCLGLPTIALSVAQNQIFLIEELEKAGAARHVCTMKPGWEAEFAAMFIDTARDIRLRNAMAKAARKVCDGRGVERVVDAIEAQPFLAR